MGEWCVYVKRRKAKRGGGWFGKGGCKEHLELMGGIKYQTGNSS